MDEDLKEALINQKYNYYKNNRKNFSEEANQIMNKILDSGELTDLDVFILLNDNKEQIEQYRKMYYFRDKASKGTMTSSDLLELLQITFPGDINIQNKIYNEFLTKNIIKDESNEVKRK